MLLEIKDIEVKYGPQTAVRGFSLNVKEGSIVALLGHNGAGKSTTLKSVVGLMRQSRGSIAFAGKDISSQSPASRFDMGLRLLPEGRGLFANLTVAENFEVIEDGCAHDRDWMFHRENIFEYFPILKDKLDQPAGQMSGGQQQMLALGLALLGRPRCLLLDEPSIGLAPKVVEDIFALIKHISATHGLSVLLVEQNVPATMKIADEVAIMNNGVKVFEGSQQEAQASDFWKFF